MTQQVTPAPAQNLTTPGKPSALGPPSDTPAAPRAPADARARAIDAARQAKRDAEGKFLPKDPETLEAKAEVSAAAPADSTPEAAEGSGEAAATPPPESEIDVRTRVRQREMRIQRELEQRQAKLEADRAQFDAQRQQFEGERQKFQRLQALRDTDPVAWAKEIELDKVMEPIVKARLLAGKPEGQIMSVEQKLAQIEQRLQQEAQQREEGMRAAQARQTQQAYISTAMDAKRFPALAAVYADDPGELITDAFKIQRHLMARRKSADLPTQEEIAQAHEAYVREVAARAAKVQAAPAPAAAPPPPAKPKIPSPADAARTAPIQRGERVESDRERRQRAALEARKAMAATNKRTRGQ